MKIEPGAPLPDLSLADVTGDPPYVVAFPGWMGFCDVRFLGGADRRLTDKLQFAQQFSMFQSAVSSAWRMANYFNTVAVVSTLSEACNLARAPFTSAERNDQ